MLFLRALTAVASAALLTLVGQAALAQSELTADEIKNAFNKQKTRGLVIVPTEQTDSSAPTEVVVDDKYVAVDKADQVNVKISFDFDSAALREDEKPKLASLCEAMKAVDVAVFQIIGHTDSSGTATYNQNLSLLRAEEVKRHMVTSCGIDGSRLRAIGMGETVPFDADNPRADANRRVEFQALG
ncbi:OmpA family protein [Sulfitobacter sp. F26204]|uniref:OmpA family protein n=1 Tax=Sulfitobacter sp. F26204 TaxID=2996014 RepID=UPI00225E683D|nr:OmpA family protein [Sulfitobacter sp. F26204]MCX7561321.1 OmpA family protein [Sulfitobacter sp. F26204]